MMRDGGSNRYRSYMLGILLTIYAFKDVDRLTLGLVLQNIKLDLALSDTQLGVLTGIAFALFFAVMGLPIARWADRGDRVTVIAVTTALWSIAVALCSTVGNFIQLLIVRIGTAIGEAGCVPPAHSLIADYFPRPERPRAMSRYLLGGPLSVVFGFFIAGWLNSFYGWRITFVLLGIPGIALAALVWFTLKEPRREGIGLIVAVPTAPHLALKEIGIGLWRNATFRHLLFCYSVMSFFNYGIQQWSPAFFIRSYGMQTGELGTWMALIYGSAGVLGIWCGGEWASRRARNKERLQLQSMAIVFLLSSVVSMFIYLSTHRYVAFALMGLSTVGGALFGGPMFAIIQSLVEPRTRAVSISIFYLFVNLIGMGFGPLMTGALSDALRPWAGEESLRYALLCMCPGYVWGAWHVWRASQSVTRELKERGTASGDRGIPAESERADAAIST